MTITVEEHEHRLYLPACSCSLPKEIAGCRFERFEDLGEGGVAIRYTFEDILTADIFVYEPDSEGLADGVDLEVFRHFVECKQGIKALQPGLVRLVSEGMFCVREFPDEPQFCCAVFELAARGSGLAATVTHLFVRSVLGYFLKIRASHSAEHTDTCGKVVVAFVGELISIFKGRS